MSRRIVLSIAIGLALVPSIASAQMRRNRNAPAMTADGPVYNPTQTPEWRQAGGNYEVWQQLMMQKMAAQQQAAFQKQQAAYQKWAKANPAATGPARPAAGRGDRLHGPAVAARRTSTSGKPANGEGRRPKAAPSDAESKAADDGRQARPRPPSPADPGSSRRPPARARPPAKAPAPK